VISASIPTEQVAACWIGVTKHGKFAYAVNAGSGSITGYAVEDEGELTQLEGDGGIFVTGGKAPTEVAIIGDRLLYVLNRDSGGPGVFAIDEDGTLFPMQNLEGVLPATTFANGLLAH
jgi:6-phosphogluconolactonase (cycloisomerase 2 family)